MPQIMQVTACLTGILPIVPIKRQLVQRAGGEYVTAPADRPILADPAPGIGR